MRITMAAIGLIGATTALVPHEAGAQMAREPSYQIAQARQETASRQRPRARIRIYRNDDDRGVYPRYNPGPNAVRDCSATYVQEFRPSGTVITPRLNCFWRRG